LKGTNSASATPTLHYSPGSITPIAFQDPDQKNLTQRRQGAKEDEGIYWPQKAKKAQKKFKTNPTEDHKRTQR
jgi:hypothetical protein